MLNLVSVKNSRYNLILLTPETFIIFMSVVVAGYWLVLVMKGDELSEDVIVDVLILSEPVFCLLCHEDVLLILREPKTSHLCTLKWTINIVIPRGDLNLGYKRLSLLEFETWRLRPLGYQGRLCPMLYAAKILH